MRQLLFRRRQLFALDKADFTAILIILLMASVVFLWFKGDYILNGVDADYPITPTADFVRSTFAWWERGLGASNVRGLALAPIFTFPQSVLSTIGVPLSAIQQLIFYLLVATSGISMYFLMRKLIVSKRRYSFAASLVSANLYMFNLFALLFLYQPLLVAALYLYVLIPIIFLFFIKSFDNKKYLAILGILFFLASPAANNPSFYAPLVILIFLYGLFAVFVKRTRKNFVNVSLTLFLVLVVFVLVNSFWILPVLTSVGQQYSIWLAGNQGAAINSYSNFSEMFRFLGWWAFSADYKGSPYFPYHSLYYTPLFAFLGFFIPLMAFLSLLFVKRFGKFVLFFGLTSIIGLFLQKGELAPLAFFNTWFYTLPGSLAFDGPKFGALYTFAIAALLGVSVQYFVERIFLSRSIKLPRFKVAAVTALFLIVINLYAWPFWTGDLYSMGPDFPPRQISIPPYYAELADYLNSQPGDFRVLGVPSYVGVPSLWVPYTWGYLGVDPLWHYLSGSYVLPNGYQGGPISVLGQLATQDNFSEMIKLASALNVRYIVVRGDVDEAFYDGCASPHTVNELLSDQLEVVYVKRFGELVLYEINNSAFSPRVYTSHNAILADRTQLFPIVASDALSANSSILLDSAAALPLADCDLNMIRYDSVNISLPTSNGRLNQVDWSSVSVDNYAARFYTGWKGIISVTGVGDPDMLIFDSPETCPYTFPDIEDTYWWSGYRSTHIYLKTGDSPLVLNDVSASGESLSLVGVWWETGWLGMGTRSIVYPLVLPPNQRVIIQVDTLVLDNVTLDYSPNPRLPDLPTNVLPEVVFHKISPVEYTVNVKNVIKPFFLVLSESFDTHWRASVDNQFVDETYHFMANGYSNVWYVAPEQVGQTDVDSFTITLYYTPQNLFYAGLVISLLSVLVCFIVCGFFYYNHSGVPILGKQNLPIDWVVSKNKVSALGLNMSSQILDIGSRDGKKARYVVVTGQLLMSDVSKRSLSPFVCCDAAYLPFVNDSFDAITMLHVLEHIKDGGGALKEIYRVLKKGGSAIIVTPNNNRLTKVYSFIVNFVKKSPYKYPMNPDHVFEYSVSDIEKVFDQSDFESYVIEPIFRQISKLIRVRQYCDQWIVTAKKW